MPTTTTPHVAPLSIADAPHDSVGLLKAIEDKYGMVPGIFGTMAHQPDVLRGVVAINDGIQKDLPGTLRELAYYVSSQANACDYCSHHHRKAAVDAGVTEEQLDALSGYADSDLFSDAEKSVLAYAETLTKTADVDDATVAAVREHISEAQLVTLAATVALANFTNRFNHGLNVELP